MWRLPSTRRRCPAWACPALIPTSETRRARPRRRRTTQFCVVLLRQPGAARRPRPRRRGSKFCPPWRSQAARSAQRPRPCHAERSDVVVSHVWAASSARRLGPRPGCRCHRDGDALRWRFDGPPASMGPTQRRGGDPAPVDKTGRRGGPLLFNISPPTQRQKISAIFCASFFDGSIMARSHGGERYQMPIRPFIQPGAFEPEVLAVMGEVFEAACKERPNVAPGAIAQRIVTAAQLGERDPARLRKAALEETS
jgi:hypothetical protein